MKRLISNIVGIIIIIVAVVAWRAFKPAPRPVACTLEAKICLDGSAVGRTGPRCEFAPCPVTSTGGDSGVGPTATDTASLNQTILNNGVLITPLALVADSRCPVDVRCIWTGEIKVQVKLASDSREQVVTLALNRPLTFAGKRVSLTSVTPAPHSQQRILSTDYRFKFLVTPASL